MRVAVCYSGQLREGLKCLDNHRDFLEGLNVDYFVHTWSTYTDKKHVKKSFEQHGIPEFISILGAKRFEIGDSKADNVSSTYNSPSAQIISWVRSIKLKQEWEDTNGFKYDFVIKLRPDILIVPGAKVIEQLCSAFIVQSVDEYNQIDDVWFAAPNNIMDMAIKLVTPADGIITHLGQRLVENGISLKAPLGGQRYTIYRWTCPTPPSAFDAAALHNENVYEHIAPDYT